MIRQSTSDISSLNMGSPRILKGPGHIYRFPIITTRLSVWRSLGLAGNYRHFITNFSKVPGSMYMLTLPKVPFKWTDHSEEVIKYLKATLTSMPLLAMYDPFQLLTLYTVASTQVLGVVLYHGEGKDWQQLSTSVSEDVVSNYGIESSGCGLVISHNKDHLFGRPYTVVTNHHMHYFLCCMLDLCNMIARRVMNLQEYKLHDGLQVWEDHLEPDCLSCHPQLLQT